MSLRGGVRDEQDPLDQGAHRRQPELGRGGPRNRWRPPHRCKRQIDAEFERIVSPYASSGWFCTLIECGTFIVPVDDRRPAGRPR